MRPPTSMSNVPTARPQTGVTLTATYRPSGHWVLKCRMCVPMFRNNHVSWILVLFVNNFSIRMTGKSRKCLSASEKYVKCPSAAAYSYVSNCHLRSSQTSMTAVCGRNVQNNSSSGWRSNFADSKREFPVALKFRTSCPNNVTYLFSRCVFGNR